MEEKSYNVIATSLEQLEQINEIEYIYTSNIKIKETLIVYCSVICDVDNIAQNSHAFHEIISILNIIKDHLKLFNIRFNYEIMTSQTFNTDLQDADPEVLKEFSDENMLYNREKSKKNKEINM